MSFLRNLKNAALGVMGIDTSGLNAEEREVFRKFSEKNESVADQAASTVMEYSTTDEERLEALGVYWFLVVENPGGPPGLYSRAALLLSRCRNLGVDMDRDNPFEGLPDFERGFLKARREMVGRFEQTGLAQPE